MQRNKLNQFRKTFKNFVINKQKKGNWEGKAVEECGGNMWCCFEF